MKTLKLKHHIRSRKILGKLKWQGEFATVRVCEIKEKSKMLPPGVDLQSANKCRAMADWLLKAADELEGFGQP